MACCMHDFHMSLFGSGEPGDIRHGVLQELGADEVVNYREEDFSEKYKDKPFDLVIDCIGGVHAPNTEAHLLDEFPRLCLPACEYCPGS